MFSDGSTARQQLDELQAVLGFDYGDQDWGIVNTDGGRVLEFDGFFYARIGGGALPCCVMIAACGSQQRRAFGGSC